jgi:hypothetical protein
MELHAHARRSLLMKKILLFIAKSANVWLIINIFMKIPLFGAAINGLKTHAFNDNSVVSSRDIGNNSTMLAQAEGDCDWGDCECECLECDSDCECEYDESK